MNRVDAGKREQGRVPERGFVTDTSDDRSVLALRDVRSTPEGFHALADMVDLVLSDAISGHDDHEGSFCRLKRKRPPIGRGPRWPVVHFAIS